MVYRRRRLEVGKHLVGLAIAVDPQEDDLACAAVAEDEAVGAMNLDLARLLGREVQLARERPFVGLALRRPLIGELAVDLFEARAADEQIALKLVHVPTLPFMHQKRRS
jgi:hypothetical protein